MWNEKLSTGLDDFKNFLKLTRELILWSFSAGVLGVIVGHFSGIAPPWPAAATPLTCASMFMALIYAYIFHQRITDQGAKKNFKKVLFFTVSCFICYISLFAFFVTQNPTNDEILIKGFFCTELARQVYTECPFLGIDELAHSNYQADQIWKDWTINGMRIMLFFLWIGAFAGYVFATGVLVMYLKQRRSIEGQQITSCAADKN